MISLSPVRRVCRGATALLFALLLLPPAEAELIPAARLTSWTPGARTGVIGGIPTNRTQLINVTQAPYNADNTGATDASAAIQAAINATTSGKVIYLPAGTYKLNSTLNISASLDNFTIRGAGPAATILKPQAGASGIAFGASDAWTWPVPPPPVTAGLSKNSTSITISDSSHFPVGALILISFEDQRDNAAIQAGAVLTFGVGGWDPSSTLRKQVTRVTAKTGNVLTISPGIYHAPAVGLSAKVSVAQLQHDAVGIEDLALDMTDTTAGIPIYVQHANGCWIKNVKISNVANYGIAVFDSLQCEIRHCEIRDRRTGGSNGAALLFNTDSGCLVEDNILYNVFPLVEVNASSCGNVFAYNLMENPNVNGSVLFGIDTNHGPHNSFNLYEGNISPNLISDGYFGSASEDTVLRNWLHGTTQDGGAITFTIALKRFTRNYSIVGNVLGRAGVSQAINTYGQPNIGNGGSSGTAQPSAGVFWADWGATAMLTVRAGNTAGTITLNGGHISAGTTATIRWGNNATYQTFTASGVSGTTVSWTAGSGASLPPADTAVEVFMQPAGYQELDLDVEASTIEKGNYFYGANGSAGSMSSLGGDTLPNSLFRSSKPAYFKNLVWPPFAPDSPNSANYESIPAGYRYVHGVDPPGSVPQGPSNLTSPSPPGPGDRTQGASPAPKAKAEGSAKPQVLTTKDTAADDEAKSTPSPSPKGEKPKRKATRKKSGS